MLIGWKPLSEGSNARKGGNSVALELMFMLSENETPVHGLGVYRLPVVGLEGAARQELETAEFARYVYIAWRYCLLRRVGTMKADSTTQRHH